MAEVILCSIEGCAKQTRACGLCAAHYARLRRHGSPLGGGKERTGKSIRLCSVEGCNAHYMGRGVCYTHYKQWQYHGFSEDRRPVIPEKRRRRVNHLGYVTFRDPKHPLATKAGIVLEHRAVMAEKIGRLLLPGENVHHINGDRTDNRPENLELWVTLQPSGQRPEDLLEWAHEIIRRYG